MPNSILITGATGFIGNALIESFKEETLYLVSRKRQTYSNPKHIYVSWQENDLLAALKKTDIVIHLAGENIGSGLWTKNKLRKIKDSRINSGKLLGKLIIENSIILKLFIQGSAIGIYGDCGLQEITEYSPISKDFLGQLGKEWESSTEQIKQTNTRYCVIRTALVMGSGGFLNKIKLPIKLFLGGHLGTGKQIYSWISLIDFISAIHFLIENKSCKGVFNFSSENNLQAKLLFKKYAHFLNRPSYLHIPNFILKLLPGGMTHIFTDSVNVLPSHLLECGFEFKQKTFDSFLKNINDN